MWSRAAFSARAGELGAGHALEFLAEIDKINSSTILPPDVKIERIYDRSGLIHTTTHTVMHNLVFGVVLVFVVQWLFLGSLRSAIIVAATIPFALGFATLLDSGAVAVSLPALRAHLDVEYKLDPEDLNNPWAAAGARGGVAPE